MARHDAAWKPPEALGQRARGSRDQIGELPFQGLQLSIECIVLAVTDDGRGINVVKPVVPTDLVTKLLETSAGGFAVHMTSSR